MHANIKLTKWKISAKIIAVSFYITEIYYWNLPGHHWIYCLTIPILKSSIRTHVMKWITIYSTWNNLMENT